MAAEEAARKAEEERVAAEAEAKKQAELEAARKLEEERLAVEEAARKAEEERKAAEEAAMAKELEEIQKSAEIPEEKPVEKEEESVDNGPKDIFEKIPGRFIVKSNKGYVVSKTQFSNNKSEARVFNDFNEARHYKAMFGGKVIKL